jgi:hypothetical protein
MGSGPRHKTDHRKKDRETTTQNDTTKRAKAGSPPVPRGRPSAPAWLRTALSKFTWASFTVLPRNFSLFSDFFDSCSAREGLQPSVPGAPWVNFRRPAPSNPCRLSSGSVDPGLIPRVVFANSGDFDTLNPLSRFFTAFPIRHCTVVPLWGFGAPRVSSGFSNHFSQP